MRLRRPHPFRRQPECRLGELGLAPPGWIARPAAESSGAGLVLHWRDHGAVRWSEKSKASKYYGKPEYTATLRKSGITPIANRRCGDSASSMIRPGFLDSELRRDLIKLARDGSAAYRLARRANALVLLDKGMSCQLVAEVLLLDNDTIRAWYTPPLREAGGSVCRCNGTHRRSGFGFRSGSWRYWRRSRPLQL